MQPVPAHQFTYVLQVSLFARHFGKSPHLLGPEDIRDYRVFLATETQLAPGSAGTAVSALRFLYRVTLGKDWDIAEVLPAPKQPSKLPVVASAEEVGHFLDCVRSTKHRAILTCCYAAGLRISDAVSRRPADIDSRRMVVRVEQGKGHKDRYIMLSPRLLEILRDYSRMAAHPAGRRVAIPGPDSLPPYRPAHRREGLPEGRRPVRAGQGDHPAQPPRCLRSTSA